MDVILNAPMEVVVNIGVDNNITVEVNDPRTISVEVNSGVPDLSFKEDSGVAQGIMDEHTTDHIALGETAATAHRGDHGKIAYEHSQSDHAPSAAQKNSDITKGEIEAKLTGEISSHTHALLTPLTMLDLGSEASAMDLDMALETNRSGEEAKFYGTFTGTAFALTVSNSTAGAEVDFILDTTGAGTIVLTVPGVVSANSPDLTADSKFRIWGERLPDDSWFWIITEIA